MAAENAAEDAADAPGEESPPREELLAQVDLLREENARLREEYARARRSQYRRTALGLLAVGLVAAAGGVLFPGARTVLFALGGTGAFAAVLTYYLTPERFVAASVGERVYATLADNEAAVAADLGLADDRVYVPTGDADAPARLFVPQRESFAVPDAADLDSPFVVAADGRRRGLALAPTGGALFEEFERALAGDLADDPAALAEQLADGLAEQFELVDRAAVDAADDGRVVVGVSGSAYGDVARFDHPVASLLAVGTARALATPVTVEVHDGDDRVDALVTVRAVEPSESGEAVDSLDSTGSDG